MLTTPAGAVQCTANNTCDTFATSNPTDESENRAHQQGTLSFSVSGSDYTEDLDYDRFADGMIEPDSELGWKDDIGKLDPISGVEDWAITVIGSRPKDYAARDLLLGSLFRDPRPRGFHRLCLKPKRWMGTMVKGLETAQQEQGLQFVALHYLHRLKLLDMLPEARTQAEAGHPEEYNMLRRLWRCWPYGAGVEWRGEGDRTERDVCRLAWLCPWCFARNITRLNEELYEALPAPGPRKYLVLTKSQILSPAFDPGLLEYYGDIDHVPAEMLTIERNDYRSLSMGEVTMGTHRRMDLEEWAMRQGITGGVSTHQIGPALRSTWYHELPCFRQCISLLGEVEVGADEFVEDVQDRLLRVSEEIPDTYTALLPADHPSALRMMLMGSSFQYPSERLDLTLTDDNDWKARFIRGVSGALALQPHFMFDDVQWDSYASMTKNKRLYKVFGSWKAALSKKRTRKKHDALPVDDDPLPSEQALLDANRERHEAAEKRRKALVERLRPYLHELIAGAHVHKRGRPSLRAGVQQLLDQWGMPATDRDLRCVLKALADRRE